MNNGKYEIFEKLSEHKKTMDNFHLRNEFENDKFRFDKYSIQFNSILFDFSKNIINDVTLRLLIDLAEKSNLKEKIEDMFNGIKINFTENRAVLHTALRNNSGKPVFVDGKNIMEDVSNELNKALSFAENLRNGEIKGYTSKKFTDVVNIGIGGSHLGPDMVCTALESYRGDVNLHFVSNVDPNDIQSKLKKLNPETTLFLIASKTFTTQETMSNANKAKEWFLASRRLDVSYVSKHFAALSTNISACKDFGISEDRIFGFWDWVGGRYSLWSVIGLSIAIYIGADNFRKLLDGAYQMDNHFRYTDYDKNIPVIMALLGVWYTNFWGAKSHAVIPYDQNLVKFPEFLQQLDMESNGKSVNYKSKIVDYNTGPVIWGTIGTNSQHSFFQLIHQGTQLIPVDFLASVVSSSGDQQQHRILLSNFFAQTQALMRGKTAEEVKTELIKSGISDEEIEKMITHKVFTGNRPTNSILYKSLSCEVLGSLIAMYEHKVFVQGIIWELNSFDQWGVELGKQLAKSVLNELENKSLTSNYDSSTNGLINYFKLNI